MRKIAFTLCLLLGSLTMHADNGKSLFVTFLDGSKIEFALADLPEVSFGEDKMKVQTSKTTATYEPWNRQDFHLCHHYRYFTSNQR